MLCRKLFSGRAKQCLTRGDVCLEGQGIFTCTHVNLLLPSHRRSGDATLALQQITTPRSTLLLHANIAILHNPLQHISRRRHSAFGKSHSHLLGLRHARARTALRRDLQHGDRQLEPSESWTHPRRNFVRARPLTFAMDRPRPPNVHAMAVRAPITKTAPINPVDSPKVMREKLDSLMDADGSSPFVKRRRTTARQTLGKLELSSPFRAT